MPIEQATEMEVPVTIQGSKSVEGMERRELFTETTKTTIVFETGAVLSLKAKVQPGQCVFLRNEQSGREMLCKVMESRSGGEVFYTDLEFTARDPEFWDAKTSPETSAPTPISLEKSATQKSAEEFAPPQVSAAAPESDKPFTGNIPVTATTAASPVLAAAPPVPLPPLELVPAHEQAAAIPVTAPVTAPETSAGTPQEIPPETPPDWDEAREQELVAALIAMEGGKASKRDSAKKETKGSATASASDGEAQQGDTSSGAESSEEGSEAAESKARTLPKWRPRSFTAAAKNPLAIGVAASLLLVVVLGVGWRGKRRSSARSDRESGFNIEAIPAAAHAPAGGQAGQPAPTQVSTVTSGNAPATAPTAATQPTASVPPGTKAAENTAASATSSEKTNPGTAKSDETVLAQAQPKSRRKNAKNGSEIIPARVVTQPAPAMPTWAKGLDTDGIVKLDAVIDEKGNVAEARPISGPRMLQGAAERAVALWVFEPALSDGKPIATHMTLTVEFQR